MREEEEKEEEEEAKKKQSVDINKDVLKEMINATAADAQQQARAIALDKQQQLCKVGEALAVLASASSVICDREREAFLKLVNEINLYGSMMHKEGTDGGQDIMKAYKAADEEINDSSDEHVPDGASSQLINLSTPTGPTLCNISRATLSSLPDEVVGITSLPSEDSVSERQEELTKAEEVEKDTKINGHPRSVVEEIEEILLPPKKKVGRPKKVRSSPPKEKNPPGGPHKRNITVYVLFSLILLPSSELDNILLKMIRDVREVSKLSVDEVYTMLKECNMDQTETCRRLKMIHDIRAVASEFRGVTNNIKRAIRPLPVDFRKESNLGCMTTSATNVNGKLSTFNGSDSHKVAAKLATCNRSHSYKVASKLSSDVKSSTSDPKAVSYQNTKRLLSNMHAANTTAAHPLLMEKTLLLSQKSSSPTPHRNTMHRVLCRLGLTFYYRRERRRSSRNHGSLICSSTTSSNTLQILLRGIIVLLRRVPEPEDEASPFTVEESRVDDLELGKLVLDKLVLDKLEVGFDHG
nr:mitochondrial proton/calcium exchanger protein-like [Tanacetum cinerariifolium]